MAAALPGSRAYDALQSALTALHAVEEEEEDDDEAMAGRGDDGDGGGDDSDAGNDGDEASDDDLDASVATVSPLGEDAAFHAAQREASLEAWIDACGRCCEERRRVSKEAGEEAVAEEYRCERECWALVGALLRLERSDDPDDDDDDDDDGGGGDSGRRPQVGGGELTAAEAVARGAAASGAARRRACLLRWLERGAVEKVRYFGDVLDTGRMGGVDCGCVDGIVARMALTAASSREEDAASVASVVRTVVDAGLEEVAVAAADERELLRAMWLLVRAGQRERAAQLAEKRGSSWRAAILRGGGAWSLDPETGAVDAGNPALDLWAASCAARARAALAVAGGCRSASARIQTAISSAARRRHGLRSDAAARLAADAVEATRDAALYDAALHAVLAGDGDTLRSAREMIIIGSDHASSWDDALWGDLACLDANAARATVRDLARTQAKVSALYPGLDDAELGASSSQGERKSAFFLFSSVDEDVGRVFDRHAAVENEGGASAAGGPLRRAQRHLAVEGLSALTAETVLGPSGCLAEAYDKAKARGAAARAARLVRLCATLGAMARRRAEAAAAAASRRGLPPPLVVVIRKRTGCDEALVDRWLDEYATALGRRSLAKLAAPYAAALSRPGDVVECCARCLALSVVRFDDGERRDCVVAFSMELGPAGLEAVALRFAALVFARSQAPEEECIAVLRWLRGGLCGGGGLEVLRHANALLRRFCGGALESNEDGLWRRAEETVGEVTEAVLESVFDASRSSGAVAPAARRRQAAHHSHQKSDRAAAALKEFLCWRALLKARNLREQWRQALAEASEEASGSSSSKGGHHGGGGGGGDAPLKLARLAEVAERAARAFETVLVFPGQDLLRRDRHGAAAADTFGQHANDGDLELRLDTLAATIARYHRASIPLGGWLSLASLEAETVVAGGPSAAALRGRALPAAALAVVEIARATADAFLARRTDRLLSSGKGSKPEAKAAAHWLRRTLRLAILVAKPAPATPAPLDDADELLKVLPAEVVARILAAASSNALELLRLAPVDVATKRPFDWAKVLFFPQPAD